MNPNATKDLTLRDTLLARTKRGDLWAPEKDGALRCFACGHRCFIPLGRDGICKVRSNVGGELKVPWGYVGGIQIDPIEKKPFFHVLPGTDALSFGMLGCDFHCGYCQNWITAQAIRDPRAVAQPHDVSVDDLLSIAKRSRARVLTSTYNEPLITSEWAVAIFREAKRQGFLASYVSNGNATPEVLEYIRPFVDFYKVDLKGFRDKPYRELGGVLRNVTESIEHIYRMGFWLEVVTLLVPGFNDDPAEIRDLCRFLKSVSPLIPWHATAFHPDYKMSDKTRTGVEKLLEAGEIAKEEGLKFVYLGNAPGRVGAWENTYCPSCGHELIVRNGFRVLKNVMVSGDCPACKKTVPGHWVEAAPV